MRSMNERPACHRAEDLVTYLYGEAGAADALDFRQHLERCDACRSEFAVFNQVHESIGLWRNEALGASFNPAAINTEPATAQVQYPARRLSALAALREFFAVSPLWLRGATAFGAMLLCVLAVLTVSRLSRRTTEVANNNPELKYSQKDLDVAVQKGINDERAKVNRNDSNKPDQVSQAKPNDNKLTQVAVNQIQPRATRPRGLTRQERQQLAADLRLIPGDDEELPFGISDEPNQ